jgi:hypothetical protein
VFKPQRPTVYVWADGTEIARVGPPEPRLIESEASPVADVTESGDPGLVSDRDPS